MEMSVLLCLKCFEFIIQVSHETTTLVVNELSALVLTFAKHLKVSC